MSANDGGAPTPTAPAGSAASSAPLASRSEAVPLAGVALGIDVGGTGVKAALVDLATAQLVTSRVREKTPQPSTPEAVIQAVAVVVERVLAEHRPEDDLIVGCGLPGAIKHGVMKTAANLDKGWVEYDATSQLGAVLGRPVHVINDADAAGMAELAFGEAKGQSGTVILLTVGTGIGSALISDGRLVPNTEFGHLILRTKASETLVSGAARVRRGLGWKRWAREFNEYLAMLEFFFWPDRIILGGGVSKESKSYWQYLSTEAELVKARFLNSSGIIGAAYAAGLAAHRAGQAPGQAPRQVPGRALGQVPGQPPGEPPGRVPGQAPGQASVRPPGEPPRQPEGPERGPAGRARGAAGSAQPRS